jgi:hypothetical protein
VERTLDLDFVRALVRDAYAESGRPSIDPVVFFTRQLVLFFAGLRSERQVMRVVADRFSCPGDQSLQFLSQCETTRRRVYEAPAAACAACTLRTQCTTSKRVRRVGRSLEETFLDRVRGYHDTAGYAKAMRKRQVWIEPLFAEAKEWHGLRRFRLRGLEKVNGEALMIAAGQNLKRL